MCVTNTSLQRMTTVINWGYVVIARFIVFDTFALETLRDSMNSNLDSARFLLSLFTVFKSHLHPLSPERASFVTQAKNVSALILAVNTTSFSTYDAHTTPLIGAFHVQRHPASYIWRYLPNLITMQSLKYCIIYICVLNK